MFISSPILVPNVFERTNPSITKKKGTHKLTHHGANLKEEKN
jgi:hypothetical protein